VTRAGLTPAGVSGPGVLEGVRVADFSHALAGPLCTMILADLGAEVVKIERPGGDQVRGWGPPFHDGDAAYYYAGNRGKRSIVLDLEDAGDHALARRLALAADVVVENSRAGVMARFALDYEALREQAPELVYCSITAFGPDGPGRLAGYDLIVQAVSGIMSVTGAADGEPMKTGIPVVDEIAGLYAAIGVLGALSERGRSGEGQLVEISLMGAATAALANRASGHLLCGEPQVRMGNAHPNVAPYELFAALDGSFVLAAATQALWIRTCAVLGREDLLLDPRFGANALRVEHRAALKRELEDTTRTRTAAEWIRRLTGEGVPAALVNDVGGAFRFAEELGLGVVEVAEAGGRGPVRMVRSPIRLSRSAMRAPTAPPRLDQHGDAIRDELAPAAPRGA
jgi:crotonobetainyl-CoA:carnitine CoA-transferase CaiB-like acyl-CoA transferase